MHSLLFALLLCTIVISEDLAIFHTADIDDTTDEVTRFPKFINVYSSHRDLTETIPSALYHPGSDYTEKVSHTQLDNTNLDRIDFHYPNVESSEKIDDIESEYGTIVNDGKKFVFLQSLKVTGDDGGDDDKIFRGTRRPKFKTQQNNQASTASCNARPSSFSKLNSDEEAEEDHKTKSLGGSTLWNLKNKTVNKIKKLFSLFTIVNFNNTECNATTAAGTYQGICYTAAECTNMSGSALGDCAGGYGFRVLAVVTLAGTAAISKVRTIQTTTPPMVRRWLPPPPPRPQLQRTVAYPRPQVAVVPLHGQGVLGATGDDTLSCMFSVYKASDNVSKMRIDFLDLELTGPTNGTCTNERLIISGQNANSQVPVICGYNTGQHVSKILFTFSVYVDVSSLTGPLQLSVLATMTSRKRFRIRICQYEDACLEPSSNCLQYYTGITGVISSFNYDQASMFSRSVPGYFNNLNYAICMKREEGYCSITYMNEVNGVEYPFQLTNVDDSGDPTVSAGQAGADILNCPDDYIVIGNTRLCGDKFNDGSTVDDFTMNADVTGCYLDPSATQELDQ
ncbi:hypothetical protein NQ318_019522 [Aromia moschata]|uniref:CUB domain-containing protein n=1 Tax=Aromia moschata TaxID=1265417 RepID=A0AAV8XXW0_9CUCU|nr:hypothetical protein NQ318_019522 [Aromia moschata]